MRTSWPHGRLPAVGVLLLCAACATSRAARLRENLESRAIVSDSRTIVSAELSPWPDLPLDEALERVRPALARPTFRNQPVLVYVDRLPATFGDLHGLLARSVLDVRLLTTSEAQAKYGSFVTQPVLDVQLAHLT